MVKKQDSHKSYFQVLLVDFLKLLSNENAAFSARLAMARVSLALVQGLHRQEKMALLQAQQIDDVIMFNFFSSLPRVGGN